MSSICSSRVFHLLLLTAALAMSALADTIHFKDGTIIKGHIVSFSGGNFVVEIGEGARRKQLTFAVAEIQSIAFDTRAPQVVTPSTNTPATYTKPEAANFPKSEPSPEPVKPDIPEPRQNAPAASSKMTPVKWNTKVAADNRSNGWTNTGWVVKKGQRIHITGDGIVSLGKGQTSPPEGIAELDDPQKLLKSVPTGALIAVVGDDNNAFIYIGAEREFIATRDGALFLGVNDGDLNDNSGAFDVTVEILPG
jgi:hypothetical protein